MAKKKRKEYQRYPLGMKQQAVARMQSGVKVTALAQELKIDRSLLYFWRRKMLDQLQGEPAGPLDLPGQRIRQLEAQVAQLEGTLGRKTQEIDFFVAALRGIQALRQPKGGRGATASMDRSVSGPARKAEAE